MRILIVATDIHKAMGGGQTVYREIIAQTPECEFFYFLRDEDESSPRPGNARGIKLLARRRLRIHPSQCMPEHRVHALEVANRFARSVRGMYFDIVDLPDFEHFGAALPTALAHHGVSYSRLVLALHGSCSTSRAMNWGTNQISATHASLENERTLEFEQFVAADYAYGLSGRYIAEWQRRYPRPVGFIDPLHFVSHRTIACDEVKSPELPSLYCVGRSERRKGNDVFIELVRWLRQGSYATAAHIGEEDCSSVDKRSPQILEEFSFHRGLSIAYRNALDWRQLSTLYQDNTILVLPVRYDTFNLVALEALFSGCPVAVSSQAGICDYLDTCHPDIPYVKIDFDCIYSSIDQLQDLVDQFPAHRQRLRTALATDTRRHSALLPMKQIYGAALNLRAPPLGKPVTAAAGFPDIYAESHYFYKGEVIEYGRQILAKRLSRSAYDRIRNAWLAPGTYAAQVLGNNRAAKLSVAVRDAMATRGNAKRIADLSRAHGNLSPDAMDPIYQKCRGQLFRCNIYREIAALERERGRDLIAAAYELRILRLLGSDKLQLLPRLTRTLHHHGFHAEAGAATAMYEHPERAEEASYAYLSRARDLHRVRQDKPFETIDDRRCGQPRVAVIVSLYNAAMKLGLFLAAIANQTLVKQQSVELILVDSGSPDSEYKIIDSFLSRKPLNAIYARSAERETIQAAWNRGIGLARAPYLVFLGVDETLYPEALEVLAAELDRNPSVDWVMANSLVTEVNEKGLLERDVMSYDRTGAGKDHVYLETCYLSWVGGMYRRTVHDRFGYYDECFSAAGDTEFKSRVLPGLHVQFIPKMLGLFLNYPDERSTAGPRAEIEDLRAWYLHRTPAGIRYAFENRSMEEAQALLGTALGYRKSYCRHLSTDIDYAAHLADFLVVHKAPAIWVRQLAPDLTRFLRLMRQLEYLDAPFSIIDIATRLLETRRFASRAQARHSALLQTQGFTPRYEIANDNRFEQHSWLWKS